MLLSDAMPHDKTDKPVVSQVLSFGIASEVAFKISPYRERHDKTDKTLIRPGLVSPHTNPSRKLLTYVKTQILFESGKHVLGRLDEQNWFTGRRRRTGRIVIVSYHGRLEQACRRLAVTLINGQSAAALTLEEVAKRIEEITGRLARAIVLHTEQRKS